MDIMAKKTRDVKWILLIRLPLPRSGKQKAEAGGGLCQIFNCLSIFFQEDEKILIGIVSGGWVAVKNETFLFSYVKGKNLAFSFNSFNRSAGSSSLSGCTEQTDVPLPPCGTPA